MTKAQAALFLVSLVIQLFIHNPKGSQELSLLNSLYNLVSALGWEHL